MTKIIGSVVDHDLKIVILSKILCKINFQKYFGFLKMDKNKCPFLKTQNTFEKKHTK